MPDLPTVNVNQEQADKILAAFGTADSFKKWLKEQVVEYVINYEARQIESEFIATREARIDDIRNKLK